MLNLTQNLFCNENHLNIMCAQDLMHVTMRESANLIIHPYISIFFYSHSIRRLLAYLIYSFAFVKCFFRKLH